MKVVVLLFFISLLFGTVSGISPFPGVTLYMHDIVLIILFIAAFFTYLRKKAYTRPKLLGPIAEFGAVAVVSLLVNTFRFSLPELSQSSLYLFRWVGYAALYIIVVQSFVPVFWWVWGLLATGTAFAVLGIAQYILYPSLRNLSYLGWDPHYYRVFSTLLDPNFAGIIFVLTILWGVYLLTFSRHRKLIYVSLGISLIALYLTYSRSSYVAFVVGLATGAFFLVKQRMRFLMFALLFLLVVVMVPKPGGDTLRLDRTVTTIARIENWQQSIDQSRQSPILGFGFNTLRFLPKAKEQSEEDVVSKAAAGVDSSILFILLTSGVVGVSVYAWLLYKQFRMGLRLIHHKEKRILGVVLSGSLLVVLVHSLFVNSLFYPWVMIWLWMITGIAERYFL